MVLAVVAEKFLERHKIMRMPIGVMIDMAKCAAELTSHYFHHWRRAFSRYAAPASFHAALADAIGTVLCDDISRPGMTYD